MAEDDAAGSKAGHGQTQSATANGGDPTGTGTSPSAGGDVASADQGAAPVPSEIERLRAELENTKDKMLRAHAELENYKRRWTREKADVLRYASEGLLKDLLPAIDNLERALAHARATEGASAIVEGVELVLRSLIETLERHGVKTVQARGERFDPSVHQAIGHVESEAAPNTVVDEHQRGYALHDRLLRPALVTVGKGQPESVASRVETPEDDG